MLLFALYFLGMGSHPRIFFFHSSSCHLSFIRHSSPTLEIIFLSSIIQLSLCWKLMQSSVMLLTPSSCFMQSFSFVYLSTIIHSPINFIQYFSFIYFSSLIQQNLIHWFVIVIHPMFTMTSFNYPSSFTSWVFVQFELIFKIHPLRS
jgi:hypothetical protein